MREALPHRRIQSSLIRMLRNRMPGPCPRSPMCPRLLKSPGWLRPSTV